MLGKRQFERTHDKPLLRPRVKVIGLTSLKRTVLTFPSILSIISLSWQIVSFQSSDVDDSQGGGFGSDKMERHATLVIYTT